MTRWWEAPLAVLELKATGLDPFRDRIVSAVLGIFAEDDVLVRAPLSFLVTCGVSIPETAVARHGIDNETVTRFGVSSAHMLAEVCSQLFSLGRYRIPLVMFNARQGWPLLQSECARHGFTAPRLGPGLSELALIDPHLLDRTFDKGRSGSRSIAETARAYDVPENDGDVVSAATTIAVIARRVGRCFSEAGNLEEHQLVAHQIRWHREWREQFNAYQARQGYSARAIGEWPGWPPRPQDVHRAPLAASA